MGDARIILYSMMGLFTEAVKLALESGKWDLAKEQASKTDKELSKKLWLQIVQHLLNTDKDVN